MILLPLLLAAASPSAPARFVTVEELAAAPERWDGQRVRVEGVAVREFEDHGLYASYADYCGTSAPPRAIYVAWYGNPALAPRFRRTAVIEGVFHKEIAHGPNEIVVSNAAPGPGPLTNVRVVRWTSGELTRCGVPDPEETGGRHVAY